MMTENCAVYEWCKQALLTHKIIILALYIYLGWSDHIRTALITSVNRVQIDLISQTTFRVSQRQMCYDKRVRVCTLDMNNHLLTWCIVVTLSRVRRCRLRCIMLIRSLKMDVDTMGVSPVNHSLTGRSSLFPIDDGLLDDGHGNQGVPGVLGSPHCYPHQNGERIERFSRKVFVGGLPPDIDEGSSRLHSWEIFEKFDMPF